MSGERTEQPTARRLEQARKKGQIARSRELGHVAGLTAAALALGWLAGPMMGRLSETSSRILARMGRPPAAGLDAGELSSIAIDVLTTIAFVAGPVALAAVAAAMAVQYAQGGFVFATEALQMNWGRLNPANGITRLGLTTGGADLLRATLAVALVATLASRTVVDFLSGSSRLARMAPMDGASETWRACEQLIRQAVIGLLAIAAGDYLFQRYAHRKSLRMTKHEVREEHKLLEGNPEIRARVRRIQREMVRRRMIAATRRATVVITNPTHYAVALEYRRHVMAAPVVVAKGLDHLALRMKDVAREHGVPIVENVPLARALYASAEVGDFIPASLFEAVAEVLAYLIRVNQLVLEEAAS